MKDIFSVNFNELLAKIRDFSIGLLIGYIYILLQLIVTIDLSLMAT